MIDEDEDEYNRSSGDDVVSDGRVSVGEKQSRPWSREMMAPRIW
jgi:hypothetical protein